MVFPMSTLTEIESAVETLSLPEQEELLKHLAGKLAVRSGNTSTWPVLPPRMTRYNSR